MIYIKKDNYFFKIKECNCCDDVICDKAELIKLLFDIMIRYLNDMLDKKKKMFT